jgi:hypothetical protein
MIKPRSTGMLDSQILTSLAKVLKRRCNSSLHNSTVTKLAILNHSGLGKVVNSCGFKYTYLFNNIKLVYIIENRLPTVLMALKEICLPIWISSV